MKVSKNISKGEHIMHLSEINKLAEEGKSVVIEQIKHPGAFLVRPAAWMQNWSIRECSKWNFYYSIKKASE